MSLSKNVEMCPSRSVCLQVFKENGREVPETVYDTVEKEECRECRPVTRQQRINVPDIQSYQVPKVECHDTCTDVCHPVPVPDCRQRKRKHCVLIPNIRTKEVTMDECTFSNKRVCESKSETVIQIVASEHLFIFTFAGLP